MAKNDTILLTLRTVNKKKLTKLAKQENRSVNGLINNALLEYMCR